MCGVRVGKTMGKRTILARMRLGGGERDLEDGVER